MPKFWISPSMPNQSPFKVSLEGIVLACSLVYGYSTLNSDVHSNTDFRVKEEPKITKNTERISNLELRVEEQSKLFKRFDKFLEAQTEMNNQLIKLNTRQEQIFKQLEKIN